MTLKNLDNLVKVGQLKKEPFNKFEFEGLFSSGMKRFTDANNTKLSIESRFDLAYNAAHSFALSALRKQGYRSNNRYIVFQVLPDTLNLKSEEWRILSKCHDVRNLAEYEGFLEISEQLLNDLLNVNKILVEKLSQFKKL